MKNSIRNMAKINVLECVPRLESGTTRQAFDKDGNLLWDIHIQETKLNEKFNIEENVINRYKSLEDLSEGEHIVEVKQTNMGEGSGSFVSVKSFYTVIRSIEKTAKIGDVLKLDGVIKPSQRAAVKNKETTLTAQ